MDPVCDARSVTCDLLLISRAWPPIPADTGRMDRCPAGRRCTQMRARATHRKCGCTRTIRICRGIRQVNAIRGTYRNRGRLQPDCPSARFRNAAVESLRDRYHPDWKRRLSRVNREFGSLDTQPSLSSPGRPCLRLSSSLSRFDGTKALRSYSPRRAR